MAYTVADRVKETTTVTGTGPATLLGAVSGYRTFASQLSIGDTCAYAIVNANASEWEVGIGTYSAANTLTRTTVHASTNSNAAVVFTAGTKDVFLSPTAETVLSDVTSTDGTVTLTKTGSIVDLSVAVAAATTNVIVQVRNTTGATLTKGTVVYINNAIGQIPTVAKALATSDATSAQTLGMVSADINDNANGYVTIIGLINDINTGSYLDGDQLYLSGTTAGAFTNVKPYAPTHLVYVGVVEHAHNVHGKIFVKVQNGYELDELHDVSAQSPSNGQTIVYNSTNQLWEKNTVSLTAGVNGILPVTNGGTGVTTATGTGSVVLSASPTLTTATFAAGTISASTPNTITQTWNNAAVTFSALTATITNASSSSLSTLIDMKVGTNRQFAVYNDGLVSVKGINFLRDDRVDQFSDLRLYTTSNSEMYFQVGGDIQYFFARTAAEGFRLHRDYSISWTPGNALGSSADLSIYRDAANTLAQRRSTNPQSFRVYNTYTDASNYERLAMGWSGNVGYIGMERAGTGSQRYVIVDLGGNPSSGANSIRTVSTNVIEIWAGNTCSIRFGGNTAYIDYFQYYGAGAIKPSNYGISSAGNANRIADKFVFRALGGGTGNTATTYIGFGAAYVPAGIASTASHTQEDCFLVRLLASATPIVAFGSDFLSTVPAIKRTGTRLISRLADDSGYATWEGPLNSNTVNAIALPSAATVTAASGNGTTITYTAANTFSVGQIVSVTGLTTTIGSSLNIANMTIATASSTQFTVTNTTVGTAAATQAGTATLQSAGNSVTITAGNGSGVGAGGNIILQPGAQGTSGGNGSVKFYDVTGANTRMGAWNSSTQGYGFGWDTQNNGTIGTGLISSSVNGTGYIGIKSQTTNHFMVESGNGTTALLTNSANTQSRLIFVNGNNAQTTTGSAGICSYQYGVLMVRDGATTINGGSLGFPQATTNISSNTNDLALTSSAFQRLNCTSPCNLTGIAYPAGGTAHADGRMIRIYNVGNANLTLSHNSTASVTQANRFWNSTGADIVLSTHQYVELIYDSTDNGRGGAGWRVSSVH